MVAWLNGCVLVCVPREMLRMFVHSVRGGGNAPTFLPCLLALLPLRVLHCPLPIADEQDQSSHA